MPAIDDVRRPLATAAPCARAILPARAQDPDPPRAGPGEPSIAVAERLVGGTKQAAPFSFRAAGVPWEGIRIDLWSGIADELGIEYEVRELPLEALVDGLADGTLDASVAALTVTPEREGRVPPLRPGDRRPDRRRRCAEGGPRAPVGAVPPGGRHAGIFSAGFVPWRGERRRNAERFGGSAAHGLGSAFW